MSNPYLEGETEVIFQSPRWMIENKLAVRVIEGWKDRAEKAEAQVKALEEHMSVSRVAELESIIARIRQVAIHNTEGNAVIPSSMILEKGDEKM